MMWAERIADLLTPLFGGVATFVVDPDELLEQPALRTVLHSRQLVLQSWSGDIEQLTAWGCVGQDQMPLIALPPDAPLYLINAHVPNAVVLHLSLWELFPYWDRTLLRTVPSDRWDALLLVRDLWPDPADNNAVAALMARAVYGIDPLHIRTQGCERALAQIALSGVSVPPEIVGCLPELTALPEDVRLALSDAVLARRWLRQHEVRDQLAQLAKAAALRPARHMRHAPRLLAGFRQPSLTAPEVSRLALEYGEACADGLSQEERIACNAAFRQWLQLRYDLVLASHHPEVIPLHQLIDRLIAQEQDRRWMLIVVDALGLEAWHTVRGVWQSHGVIGTAHLHAGWAIAPTLTSWSRRALFECALPPHFGREFHSAARERRLWARRVPNGEAFHVSEHEGILDAMRQGKTLCILDVSWDELGHTIDPAYQSLTEAAARWAERCQAVQVVTMALEQGYRCIITSDHGQLSAQGVGVPPVGELAIERSKRCLIFRHDIHRSHFSTCGDAMFQPITLPKNNHLVLARYGESFDAADTVAISHGGVSIEELIVPVVEVIR